MPVHCEKDLNIEVSVTDSSGRRFDNISSLNLEWSVSNRQLASVLHPEQLLTEVISNGEGGGNVRGWVIFCTLFLYFHLIPCCSWVHLVQNYPN